jgi:hypothetical protein
MPARTAPRITKAFRVTPELDQQIVAGATASGRSEMQHMEMLLQRAVDAEVQIGGLFDLVFGQINSAIAALLGLILVESEGNTSEPPLSHPDGNATIAAALAWTIAALTETDITVVRPEHISQITWDMRLNMCLRPVARILDHLDNDPEGAPLRPLDEEVIKKLGFEFCRRLQAKPFPVDPTRPRKPPLANSEPAE